MMRDIDNKTIIECWENYRTSILKLKELELIRSFKSPPVDFAEFIVAKMLHGTLAEHKNEKGFDVSAKGMKIQVKSIAKSPTNRKGYSLKDTDKANDIATHYAFVYFENLSPRCFFLISTDQLKHFKTGNQMKLNKMLESKYFEKIEIDFY